MSAQEITTYTEDKSRRKLELMSPHEVFLTGRALLDRNQPHEAMLAFQVALDSSPDEPLYMSYLGLAMAQARRDGRTAIGLCESAARKLFFQPDLFFNLGRVYLLAGKRNKAHAAFLQGIEVDATYGKNMEALENMGVRRPAVFPFLHRQHPVNKYAGIALHRLGLR